MVGLLEAPVVRVLEHQHPQHHLGRRLLAPSRAALLAAPQLRLPDRLDQFLVFQNVIGHTHPTWPEVAHFVSPKAITQAHLLVAPLDHGTS
jgi:hypothetical protein